MGIDVGGTFTDVVAIDAATRAVVARVKVPTSHDAGEGVAEGIVAGIERLLRESNIAPDEVAFIAHSTTQATNALLEGDLAEVGVVGVVRGTNVLARRQMHFGSVDLTEDFKLEPRYAFVRGGDRAAMTAAVDRLIGEGAQAIAASEAFGVDRPEYEAGVAEYARSRGVDATTGHDVSATYGLRARTRTAALNAAMLPRMIRTSRVTAAAVARAAIPAPLMVVRSDGGVMDVREIERRPILTLLSGPAAGVAGALLYENLTDGIFVEVGGTSSDCSAISAGRPQMQPARIGGHRTTLHTLDVRTVGIGGGSMLRVHGGAIADVGPRSAHIAGCAYACFSDPRVVAASRIEFVAPTQRDPSDYAVLIAPDGTKIALTTTCAANLLGTIPDGAFARGDVTAARAGFAVLAQHIGGTAEELARRVLELAAKKLRPTIDGLALDYRLEPSQLTLVGGGGGSGAIVPFLAETIGLPYRIARDAEVIAPIGAALALVRDVVERTINSPTPEDIARLRREAIDRVVASGANPDRVEVVVEIDAQRSRVRATASGATSLSDNAAVALTDENAGALAAARSLSCEFEELESVRLTHLLTAHSHRRRVRIADERGVIRLALPVAEIDVVPAGEAEERTREAIERETRFGDVGRALPAVYVAHGARIAAFEGVVDRDQAVALVCEELRGCAEDELVSIVTVARSA
ncbi:MAG TPA: hydantoinase/oxoprolinase family protein [Candidatus Tumulicola sp.]